MYVTELHIEGLRHAPSTFDGLERVVKLPEGPTGTAIADALTLFAVGLAPGPRRGVDQLGWGHPLQWLGDGPDELHGLASTAVDAAVDPDSSAVKIEAVLALDPPLYGRLRAEAVRDPRVAEGLGQDAELSLKVGWLFNGDRSVATPSLLGVRLGNRPFDVAGADRPQWLPRLVVDLAARFARTSPFDPATAVRQLFDASLHPTDDGADRAFSALQSSYQLPSPRFARLTDELEVVFGPAPLRLHHLGRRGADALRLVTAAYVARPDVLVALDTTAADGSFLDGLPDADDAPVEQVFLGGPGA